MPMDDLLQIMSRLRSPDGCPWDRQQTHETLRPYCIEEAFEVVDAIDLGDDEILRAELGDLLLQVVFHAQVASERGAFDFDGVVEAICDKMVRRHPHVFGPQAGTARGGDPEAWEAIKAAERAEKGMAHESALDGVPRSMPSLLRAERLGEKAAAHGFDWPEIAGVRAKLDEEIAEFDEAVEAGSATERIAHELGDILLTTASLCRRSGLSAEFVLQQANDRFQRRFQEIERRLREEGRSMDAEDLEQLEERWQAAKAQT